MARPKITLFLDTVSPFAYLAFYALQNFPIFQQCEITYVPIFLGGLMKACSNTPPINIKNKDKWINVERIRWARQFDIPMADEIVDGFPILTLNVQRALTAIHSKDPSAFLKVQAALFNAVFAERKQVQRPEVAIPIFARAMGISDDEATALLQQGGGAEAKALLVKNTDAAFKEGAFGLPWFIATNSRGDREGFWGFDHLGQVVDFLGLERPSSRGWKSLL